MSRPGNWPRESPAKCGRRSVRLPRIDAARGFERRLRAQALQRPLVFLPRPARGVGLVRLVEERCRDGLDAPRDKRCADAPDLASRVAQVLAGLVEGGAFDG